MSDIEPLATLDELTARLDWTLDDDEVRAAPGYLEEASDLARAYGRSWPTAASAPRLVRNTVLAAVRRFMRNPEGYTQSRAGDETLAWTDLGDEAGSIYFTEREIKLISGFASKAGLSTAGVTAWGPQKRREVGFVPVDYAGDPFPMFASEDDPW